MLRLSCVVYLLSAIYNCGRRFFRRHEGRVYSLLRHLANGIGVAGVEMSKDSFRGRWRLNFDQPGAMIKNQVFSCGEGLRLWEHAGSQTLLERL